VAVGDAGQFFVFGERFQHEGAASPDAFTAIVRVPGGGRQAARAQAKLAAERVAGEVTSIVRPR
jgi:hypothetical protein